MLEFGVGAILGILIIDTFTTSKYQLNITFLLKDIKKILLRIETRK